MFWSRAFGTSALILVAGNAVGAPSSSCAGKFLGTWQHSTTNIATLTRDGRAICSGNPFCQQGTWTCDGNNLTYVNGSGTYVYTLQPNGTMTYGSHVVTRIDGGSGKRLDTASAPKSLPIQTGYQPAGSQPLRAGKKIAADPAPEGLDLPQRGMWDVNEFVSDHAKKLSKMNPAKRIILKQTEKNRQGLETEAYEQRGSGSDK